jgi:hypothetical protein
MDRDSYLSTSDFWPPPYGSRHSRRQLISCAAGALLSGSLLPAQTKPRIEFTRIPPADKGGPEVMDKIEGRVTGAKPTQRIVLFARSEAWWLQPGPSKPYTDIQPDHSFSRNTHLGSEYAALLVEPEEYHPQLRLENLPREGGPILAVVVVPGDRSKQVARRLVQFSGFEWTIRNTPSDRGGSNDYDWENASTDTSGALHLKLNRKNDKWKGVEAILKESFGYGTYRFVVRDISHLDPAAVFSIYTWDGAKDEQQNPREWDFEFSRWGNPSSKNVRYVIQPLEVPGHTDRFEAPSGVLIHSIRWESGRATFRTMRGSQLVHEHSFTSGVPAPADEKLRFNLYDFQRGPQKIQKEAEVIVDRFEFLP